MNACRLAALGAQLFELVVSLRTWLRVSWGSRRGTSEADVAEPSSPDGPPPANAEAMEILVSVYIRTLSAHFQAIDDLSEVMSSIGLGLK